MPKCRARGPGGVGEVLVSVSSLPVWTSRPEQVEHLHAVRPEASADLDHKNEGVGGSGTLLVMKENKDIE